VCVVDGLNGLEQLNADASLPESEGVGESLRQIAGADVVLLNKVDLAPTDLIERTETLIMQVNPAVKIHRTVRGDVDLGNVVGIRAYRTGPSPEHIHDEHCGHGHGETGGSTHYEVRGISSLQMRVAPLAPTKLDALDAWLRSVLWDARLPPPHNDMEGIEVLRSKGLIRLTDGRRLVLQGVKSMYELEETAPGGMDEEGKLVFIGRGLGETVRRSLQSTLGEA